MLISAIICTYDRYAGLGNCLGTLERQTLQREQYEIIVVDNTPERAESDRKAASYAGWRNLRWIHQPRPGLSNARNLAMWQARAPLLAFIDDDALASPDWLAALVDAFAGFGESVHIVGGPVRPAWSGARPQWLADGLLGYLSLLDRGSEARVLGDGEWVAGTNVAYRAERLRAAGGFAPALGRAGVGRVLLSNDETELEERIKAAGGGVGWAPAAAVEHRIDDERLQRRGSAAAPPGRRCPTSFAIRTTSASISPGAGRKPRNILHSSAEGARCIARQQPSRPRHVPLGGFGHLPLNALPVGRSCRAGRRGRAPGLVIRKMIGSRR